MYSCTFGSGVRMGVEGFWLCCGLCVIYWYGCGFHFLNPGVTSKLNRTPTLTPTPHPTIFFFSFLTPEWPQNRTFPHPPLFLTPDWSLNPLRLQCWNPRMGTTIIPIAESGIRMNPALTPTKRAVKIQVKNGHRPHDWREDHWADLANLCEELTKTKRLRLQTEENSN